MAIADTLRKAASLFVVMPESQGGSSAAAPEPAKPEPSPPFHFSQTAAPDAAPAGESAASMSEADLEKRLAAMNSAIQGIHSGGGPPAGPTTGPVSPPPMPAAGASAPASSGVKTIDELLQESEGPSLNEIRLSSEQAATALTPEGTLDFPAIYQSAALPPTPFSAEQTLEMLAGLPADLPLQVKRQTVQVTVSAMGKSIGATPETIVADATRKLAAIAAYDQDFATKTEEFARAGEAEIDALLRRVQEKQQAIQEAREKQQSVRRQCEAEVDRLDDILEFFSLDIGPSKYAAPPAAGTVTPPPLPPDA